MPLLLLFLFAVVVVCYIFPHIRLISTVGSTTRPNKKPTNKHTKLARTTADTATATATLRHFIYHRECIFHFSILRSAFRVILDDFSLFFSNDFCCIPIGHEHELKGVTKKRFVYWPLLYFSCRRVNQTSMNK